MAPTCRAANGVPWCRHSISISCVALRLDHREGDYLFVHAGIRSGVRLDDRWRTTCWASGRVSSRASRTSAWSWCTAIRRAHADNQAEPHRHRHRRGERRQADLCGVRGRRDSVHVGIVAIQQRTTCNARPRHRGGRGNDWSRCERMPPLTGRWSSAGFQAMFGQKCRIDDAPKIDEKGARLILTGEKVSVGVILSLSRTIGSRCSAKGIPDINNPAADRLNGCSQWQFLWRRRNSKAEIKSRQAISPAKARPNIAVL